MDDDILICDKLEMKKVFIFILYPFYPPYNMTTSCRTSQGFYPSFAPVIDTLSVTTSAAGVYTSVSITGSNYLPVSCGTTYVNFGTSGQQTTTYYSSNNLSFTVPSTATAGTYNVIVVNVYSNNFSPQVNSSYPSNSVSSNSVVYTVT